MPELPEVETIKRILEPQLVCRTISSLALNCPDIISHPTPEVFAAATTKSKITEMDRRGKYLSILLANGNKITLHLRMTGCLLVTPPGWPEEKHTHLVFHLDDGYELRYIDPRRFGRFWLFYHGEEDAVSGIHKLGLEPFDPQMNAAYLSGILSKRKRAIKDCLLNQTMIAGIGNIYADEILFAAKIKSDRKANTITHSEWAGLANTIPVVLYRAVEGNAITPEEYLAGKGQEYRNTPTFQVYGHSSEPCPYCGEILRRIVVAGRGSVFCPTCQEE